MIVSETQAPPVGGMGGSIHSWERSLDPWHQDAFPDEFKVVGTDGERKEGWLALDAVGNPLGFIPDGTLVPDITEEVRK
jgi:hypothetical protein